MKIRIERKRAIKEKIKGRTAFPGLTDAEFDAAYRASVKATAALGGAERPSLSKDIMALDDMGGGASGMPPEMPFPGRAPTAAGKVLQKLDKKRGAAILAKQKKAAEKVVQKKAAKETKIPFGYRHPKQPQPRRLRNHKEIGANIAIENSYGGVQKLMRSWLGSLII